MNQQNILELAKQGDANAIASLLDQQLQSQNIAVKAGIKHDCLNLMLESPQVPKQQSVLPLIRDELVNLGIQAVTKVKIYGREKGEYFPEWYQEFAIEKQGNLSEVGNEVESQTSIVKTEVNTQLSVQKLSFLGGITKIAKNTGGAIANTTSQAGKVVAKTATGVSGAIADTTSQAGKVVLGKATEVGGSIVGTTAQAGKNVVGKATEVGGAIATTASQASKVILEKATNAVSPIVEATGKTIQTAKNASTDWLVRIVDQVDVVKAETEVRKLQQQYPNEQPNQIAHRLMLDKALIAAGTGLVSNLMPGTALALAGLDLAATTALSTELIYQIAAAYGQDLQSPERKGEVLTIFGLSLSGNLAVEAGLGLLGNIPVVGAAIGASSNAAMIYALGYGACRFYDAKLNPLTMVATLEVSKVESEKYLEDAIAQQVIMDQILVHVILAGHPEKSWEQMLPELQTANLSPASLDAIAFNINSVSPLETLLEQINSDFAVPLLAQCQKIAQLDGVITPEESQVIETLASKFGLTISHV